MAILLFYQTIPPGIQIYFYKQKSSFIKDFFLLLLLLQIHILEIQLSEGVFSTGTQKKIKKKSFIKDEIFIVMSVGQTKSLSP